MSDLSVLSELSLSSILCVMVVLVVLSVPSDMEFVQNFTPRDFQAKNFTPSISPNFNSFSKKKAQKMSENGEIYTAGKNFTLSPAVTSWTNSTSDYRVLWLSWLSCLSWWQWRPRQPWGPWLPWCPVCPDDNDEMRTMTMNVIDGPCITLRLK